MREYRRGNERSEIKAGCAQARRVLREVLGLAGLENPDEADIGYVRFIDSGLSYQVYWTTCRHPKLWGGTDKGVVVRLPRRDAPSDQAQSARREIQLLAHVSNLELPVRVPTVLGSMDVKGGVAVVQELIGGRPLDFRRDKTPWQLVAEAASICQGIDPQPLESILPGHPTRRAHALSALGILDELDSRVAEQAREWAQLRLPPDDRACLIHGDLLGQNLLVSLDQEPLGILDWSEARIGDPAYDLAIVTRGVRKPFGIPNGMTKLLQAYNARSGIQVQASEVQFHEMCLLAGFCRQAERDYGRGSAHAMNQEQLLANFLRRA